MTPRNHAGKPFPPATDKRLSVDECAAELKRCEAVPPPMARRTWCDLCQRMVFDVHQCLHGTTVRRYRSDLKGGLDSLEGD